MYYILLNMDPNHESIVTKFPYKRDDEEEEREYGVVLLKTPETAPVETAPVEADAGPTGEPEVIDAEEQARLAAVASGTQLDDRNTDDLSAKSGSDTVQENANRINTSEVSEYLDEIDDDLDDAERKEAAERLQDLREQLKNADDDEKNNIQKEIENIERHLKKGGKKRKTSKRKTKKGKKVGKKKTMKRRKGSRKGKGRKHK
jgi:hypothetical protein